MTGDRLPDGFAVRIDRRVRTLGAGSALLGGSPTRLLRLAPAAQAMMAGDRLEVSDAVSADLARTLLDTGVAHPRPAGGPSYLDVTVVIPVRDNFAGLHRLVMALRGLRVVIVDDGSATPVRSDWFANAPCEIEVVRHERSRGPRPPATPGWPDAAPSSWRSWTPTCYPAGWLESLLGHFCDPTVALVAPRIVALHAGETAVGRYEAARSTLDLGEREAPVVPYGPVSYVPSAAIVCRRSAVLEVGGFDESLHSGEDVDLCWRLVECGSRLRYEPVAMVAHDHRSKLVPWMYRRAFYGGSAAPLSSRHPDNSAPLVIPPWSLLTWASLATGSVPGCWPAPSSPGSLHPAGGRRGAQHRRQGLRRRRAGGPRARQRRLQLSEAVCRPYWPVALAAAVVSRRARRAVAAAAVIDAAQNWITRKPAPDEAGRHIGPLAYMALKRLDDISYGAGLWAGVIRERTLRPLRPDIKG